MLYIFNLALVPGRTSYEFPNLRQCKTWYAIPFEHRYGSLVGLTKPDIFYYMNIFYNFEVDDDLTGIPLKDELKTYLIELKSFVKTRFKVLEDEINNEESMGTKMIVLMIPFNVGDYNGIVYNGYSKDLVEKLKNCLSIDDIQYLQRKLGSFL